ncbi:MAG: hypothetical protein E4H02_02555, partial [Lentisphaerales bacterium]
MMSWEKSLGGAGSKGGKKGAVGVTLMWVGLDNTVDARIEDGAIIHADSLLVGATNDVLSVEVAASGGTSDNIAFNGVVIFTLVNNKTTAQVENGAVLDIGSNLALDPAEIDPADNGSPVVLAEDNTVAVNVAGGVAVSGHVGIGAAIGIHAVLRDTQAVIGDLASDTESGTRGSITAGGNVRVTASNSGFVGTMAAAGSVARSKADTGPVDAPGPGGNPGTGGTQGSDGSSQSNSDLASWQSKWSALLLEGKDQGKLQGNVAGDTTSSTSETSQNNKSAVGVSGSVALNVVNDDARAYLLNTGIITVTGGMLAVDARNSASTGSLAGSVAFASSSGSATSAGIAGAFNVNVLYGSTEAYVDDATSVTTDGLSINAERTGWNVAIAAGFGGAVGQKSYAVAGSVGVSVTTYSVTAALRNTTGTVDGTVDVTALDNTNLIAIAGAGGFGGKAGFGVAIGFSYTENTTVAEISGLTNFEHTGDVSVTATGNCLIVTVTGSAGVATGSGGSGYAGAGTVSVNIINNSIEAKILTTTTTVGSTGSVTVQADDKTSIYCFAGAFAAGKTVGVGAAIAVNAIDNEVRAAIEDSTLRMSGDFTATASETGTVVTLAASGAGAEKVAIAGSVAFNLLTNDIDAHVTNSTITAGGAVEIAAEDREVSVALAGGMAVSTSQGAGGAAIGVNVIVNNVTAVIDPSTVTSTGSTAEVRALANGVLVSVTLGGAGGDKFALGGSLSTCVVINTVEAKVLDGSTLSASGDVYIHASDNTTVVMVAGGFAGSSKAAVGVAVTAVYVGNTIGATVDDSTVSSTSGTITVAAGIEPPAVPTDLATISLGTSGIEMPSTSSSQIINVTVGGAGSGKFAAGVGLAVNIINNTITAGVSNGSNLDAGVDVVVSAIDKSVIDALAFGGAGSGSVAGGGAIAANTITNTIEATVADSTVDADDRVMVNAVSSSIIRALAIGVSGGSKVAVSVSALGNGVANTVTAKISGSTVTADGDISLSASDEAPLVIPTWGLSAEQQANLDEALEDSPVALDANILAIMVSVAGSGDVAVSVSLMGNVVANTIEAVIEGSTVRAGVDAGGTITNADADVFLTALSDSGITAISVGVGASGKVAIQASGFGNVITNTTRAAISGGSTVNAGGLVDLNATDQSRIASLGLSIAASGNASVAVIVGANVITNDITAEIAGSTVTSGTTLDIDAESKSIIFALVGGVAASGSVGVQITLAGNVVTNSTSAFIRDEDLTGSLVDAGGAVSITAKDRSSIDALAFGVAGAGTAAVGVAMAANAVANTVEAAIESSSVETDGALELISESSAIIRTLGVGVAGSGTVAVQVSVMGNAIVTTTTATISDSVVQAGGDVILTATDLAPSIIPDWIVPADRADELNENLDGSPIDLDSNILAVQVSVAASGTVAVNVALMGNVITNTVRTEISESTVRAGVDVGGTVTDATADVILESDSKSGIIAITIGVAGSGAVAVNATGFGNVIVNTVEALITGGSTVNAGGAVALSAADESMIRSLGVSVAGTGAVAVGAIIGANVVTNTITAGIAGSTVTAGSNDYLASPTETVTGVGVWVGAEAGASIMSFTAGVAGSGAAAVIISLSANVVTNSVEARIVDEEGTGSVIDAGGAVILSAANTSTIDAMAFGVAGTGGGAVGVGLSANVITNTTSTGIIGSTVESDSTVSLSSVSSAIIRTLSIGVSGSGGFAVRITVMGSVIVNTVTATIDGSTVLAGGDVTLAAQDIAPLAIPEWMVPDDREDELNDNLAGSPIDLDANILAVMVSVAGTGGVAVNGAFSGNVISNTIRTEISGSTVRAGVAADGTVTNADADVLMSSRSKAAIIELTVGVASSGAVAVNATGFGNAIANTVDSLINGESVVKAGGAVGLSSADESSVRALGVSVAGTGAVAVGAIIGANVITNTIRSQVAGSTVTTGSNDYVVSPTETVSGIGVWLSAESKASIMGFTAGVAGSGAAAVIVSLSANVISNTVEAEIVDELGVGSNVDAAGAVMLSATDTSSIDSLSFGVAGTGGGAVGVGLSGNIVVNTVGTTIAGSTVNTDSAVSLESTSSSIIRALAIGVSGSGGFAVRVTVMGNVIVNSITATISSCTVTAGDDVSLTALDLAPSVIPEWMVPDDREDELNDSLIDCPVPLNSNILAVMVSVAGTGGVAVGVALSGNVIANTVLAQIVGSTVRAGVEADGTVTNSSADVLLTADSSSGIIAITVGVGGSGAIAVSFTGFGNVIVKTVDASVSAGSTVRAGGIIDIGATEGSRISSIGLSIAGSGGGAISGVVGYNRIENTITGQIAGSTATSGGTLDIDAESGAVIQSFVGGVAFSGIVAAQLSLSLNDVTKTVEASIVNSGATRSNINTGGAVTLTARDASTVDSVAIGLAASGGGAAGAAVSKNTIRNTIRAAVTQSDMIVGGLLSLTSESASIIRSVAAGIGAAGSAAGNASLTLNDIVNTVEATVTGSTIEASGTITLTAAEKLPDTMADYLDDMSIPADIVTSLADLLSDTTVESTANIVSFAGSIALSGGVAGSAAVAENTISNTVRAVITDSDVESTGGDISLSAESDAKIVTISAGIGASGGVALNASVSNNTITNPIEAAIAGNSEILAAGDVEVDAGDSSDTFAVTVSLAGALFGALGGAVVTNSVTNTAQAYVAGTDNSEKTKILKANALNISARSDHTVTGKSLGVSVGGVAAGATVVTSTVGGSVDAYIGDYVEVGQDTDPANTVGSVHVWTDTDAALDSDTIGVSAGIVAGNGTVSTSTYNPTISATVAPGAMINVAGDFTVESIAEASATSNATGVTVGLGVALGASVGTATVSPTIATSVQAGGTLTVGGALTVQTLYNHDGTAPLADQGAIVDVTAGSGGLLAGTGAVASVTAQGTVNTFLDGAAGSHIRVGGAITVSSDVSNVATADVLGLAFGAVGVGASVADATAGGTNSVYAGGPDIRGQSLSIRALSQDTADASTVAGAGGILAGSGSVPTAIVSPVTSAYLEASSNVLAASPVQQTVTVDYVFPSYPSTGQVARVLGVPYYRNGSQWVLIPSVTIVPPGGSTGTYYDLTADAGGLTAGIYRVERTGDVFVGADAVPTATAFAKGINGGLLAVGVSKATATASPVVSAFVGPSCHIDAASLTVGASQSLPGTLPTANAEAYGAVGGLVGIDASLSTATNTGIVTGYVGSGSVLTIEGATQVTAANSTKQVAISSNDAYGLIAVGAATATASSVTTTQAYLGNSVTLTGYSLNVTAAGNDSNSAETTVGSGGVVSGAAAAPTTSCTATVVAQIGTPGVAGGATVTLTSGGTGAFELVAAHYATSTSTVVTTSYGALSGSGADSSNTVTSNVNAAIGNGSHITALSISVLVGNRVDITTDIQGSTGGIVSGAGAESTTTISLTTQVTIGSNVYMEVIGPASNDDVFQLAALNIVNVNDKIVFTTGGALAGAGADVTVEAMTDLAKVQVGANSRLLSPGAMTIWARGSGEVYGIAEVETYGAGTVSVGTSRVELHPRNEIDIGGGSLLQALGDLNLSTGRSADADMLVAADNYTVEARWDGFAGSAIPISDIDAEAYIVQENAITVQANALLRTGRQANLYAERYGSVALTGKAKAVSWASEVGDALSEAMGGGGDEQFSGKELAEAHGVVEVNGTIETGLTRNQSLTLNGWDPVAGTVTGVSDLGISFTTSFQAIESQMVQQLNDAEAMLAEYGSTNSTLAAFYQGEITRITAELEASGMGETVTAPDGTVSTIYPRKTVLTVTVGPIWAQAGVIDVRTDQFQGSGTLIAPSDTTVTIINNTPAFLELTGITIPAINGGVFFNGILMERNLASGDDDIGSIRYWNETNAADDNAQGFSGVDPTVVPGVPNFTLPPPGAGNTPTIIVRNDLDVNSVSPPQGGSYPWPDIKVLSPSAGGLGIFNDGGDVTLQTLPSGMGSIRIEGTVRAANIIVIAGGDVYITGLTSYSVGGEPASLVAGATTGTYGAGSATAAGVVSAYVNWPIDLNLKSSFDTATDNAPRLPYSMYGDRIHIDAEYINVNGIMQSGRDSYTLNIDGAAYTEVVQAVASGKSGRIYLTQTTLANPGFSVFFDTTNLRFEVNELRTSGGYIELFGHLLNTGYGEIKVLGGYPAITINNTTAFDVAFERIDVSQQGTGILILVDKAIVDESISGPVGVSKADTGAGPYVTIYQWTPTGVIVTTNGGSGSTEVTATTGYASTYQPADNWRYGWTTVVSQNLIKKKYTKSGAWLGVVPDIFQSESISWDSIEVQGTPQYAGSGPYYYLATGASADAAYTYDVQTVTTGLSAVVRYWHDDWWTWYGSHVYEARYRQTENQEVLHTHTVDAHRPIAVTFIGDEYATVSVNSNSGGSIVLLGPVVNPSGTTTISTSGSVQAIGDAAYVSGRQVDISAGTGIGSELTPLSVDVAAVPYAYSSTDGLQLLNTPTFTYASTQGTQSLTTYDRVRVDDAYSVALGTPGSVYTYVGVTASINLGAANYQDASKWARVFPDTQDIVRVGEDYYTYIGSSAQLDLGTQSYSGSAWSAVTLLPKFSASTTAGGITVVEINGDLPIDVVSAESGGNVSLEALGGMPVAKENTTDWYTGSISGGAIRLVAGSGGVGNGPGTAAAPAMLIDSGVVPAGGRQTVIPPSVYIQASGNVFIHETAGDLWIDQLITTGSAWIRVSSGSLLDANTEQVRDERTYDELKNGVWADLNLVGADAEAKRDATILSFESQKEREYHTYWQYRYSQDTGIWGDPPDYDAGQAVTLGAQEEIAYRDFFTLQGQDEGLSGQALIDYVDGAIVTLNNSRTAQYHTLHAQFDTYFTDIGEPARIDTYESVFDYTVTAAERGRLEAGIKIWTEDELLALIGAGLLKSVTDTVPVIEAANIVASDITVIVTNDVGQTTGQTTILVDGHEFTDDERVAFAAAERSDVTYLAAAPVTATVNFDAASRTITGTGIGVGLSAGAEIKIAGATSKNATDGLRYYTVASATANSITLIGTDTLVTEWSKSVSIVPILLDPAFDTVGSFDVSATFSNNGYTATGRAGDTITRTDGGSWIADGFVAGSLVKIAGNTENATDVGQYYRISNVTSDVLTIGGSVALTTEATSADITVTLGASPTIYAIRIDERDDVNIRASGNVVVSAVDEVYLGSAPYAGVELSIRIESVDAGGDVRIKAGQG